MYWIGTHVVEVILMVLVALGLIFEICLKIWANKKFVVMNGVGEVALIKKEQKERVIIRSQDAK